VRDTGPGTELAISEATSTLKGELKQLKTKVDVLLASAKQAALTQR